MNNSIHPNKLKHTIEPAMTDGSGRVSRRVFLKTGLGVAVLSTGAGTFFGLERAFTHAATSSSTDVVIQWNNAVLQAIRNVNPGPTIASRALAITHTCMYDAWTAYDANAVPTQANGISKTSLATSNMPTSISYAAYRALMDLFPTQATLFNLLMTSLGYDPSNTSTDTSTPAGIGNVAAQAVISYRHNDGSNQLGNLNNGGAPYSDYTGYTPVNQPTSNNAPSSPFDPNQWQPLHIPITGATQKYLTPQWGQVTPFALTSASQFRPSGPYLYTSGQQNQDYIDQVNTILSYSAGLNDLEKAIAYYWANGPHSETPPGHWALFAQVVSQQYHYDTSTNVKLFFALSNALLDAGIACWDCKRAYNSIRPITAVRFLCAGQQVQAWGGIGQPTVSMDGSQWMPYQEADVITPPFPEYVSGHSTFSAAGAYILQQFTGSSAFNYSYTVPADSSVIEPGIAPSTNITLSWATFTDAANQAGISRQYGGIHFNKGDLDGRALGASVGSVVWNKVQSYISGNFQPGPIVCTPSPSSIQSNFNGSSIAGGNFLWFTSVLQVHGLPTSGPTTVSFSGQTIQCSANGTSYRMSVPDATVTFDPSATSAITTFTQIPNGGSWIWQTTVPVNASGNAFLSGLAIQVPSGGLPGGINPVTWSGTFSSTSQHITINWQWGAAVYTGFSTNYNSLVVKATDDNHYPPYQNSDHAGTPENCKSFVTGGAGGGGGANFTGASSGTASVQC